MRLAAQAKGGFYPTPPRVVDLAAELVAVGGSRYRNNRQTLRLLDPCCGAGEAPSQLAQRLTQRWAVPVETCGVELHQDPAEEAAERLNRALAADLFQTSIANGAFGLLFLNPPYDHDSEDKRVEHSFLTHCTRYLAEGGVLMFIVPRQRLAVSARYLASHYWDLRCWAFPSPERDVFDQKEGRHEAHRIHRQVQGVHRQAGGGLLPAPLPALGGLTAPAPAAAEAPGRQADAIRGAALSLEACQGTTVVGEMGTGKTFIGAAAAHIAGFRRVLILCPRHLTRKWKREIEDTVPNGQAAIVASITDLERLRLSTGPGPLFAVMSRKGPSCPTVGSPP